MIVKIERYYKYPDLKRQTQHSSFKWKDITFTEEEVTECDYLVILDYPKKDIAINVNRNNILHLCLEPANEVSKYRQFANRQVAVNFNQTNIKTNNVLSHGALPWHIDKDYDFLINFDRKELVKNDTIVWVTSNQRNSKGHVSRMNFLDIIKNLEFVKLYGRGIQPIDNKWDVLSTSKYAIAYENFQNDYNWTEKIVDCYLSYTMPLYFGCSKINNFFPKESYIQLDPLDKHIELFLKEVVTSKKWENSLEAIEEARNLVLNEYQLFPFLYNQIKAIETSKGKFRSLERELINIKGGSAYYDNAPLNVKMEKTVYKLMRKLERFK